MSRVRSLRPATYTAGRPHPDRMETYRACLYVRGDQTGRFNRSFPPVPQSYPRPHLSIRRRLMSLRIDLLSFEVAVHPPAML